MIRIRDISLAPGHTPEQLRAAAARALRLSPREILNLQIVRRSLDARNQERIRWIYAVDVTVDGREELAIRRVVRMVKEGTVETISGHEIAIRADSICVHGDNPKALEFVKNIREALAAEGVEVRSLAER